MANSMDGQNSVLSVVGPLATNAASLRFITQAFLDQKPWDVDPMVHEIPWRYMEENSINENIHDGKGMEKRGGKLCFGVLRSDGVVTPMPPVKRAIDILVAALEKAGHEVIEWEPPSHRTINDTCLKSWVYDGGQDVKAAFALSGEPMSDQVKMFESLDKEFTATEIAATNVEVRALKKEYLDYWGSTAQKTSTGRSVDAVISLWPHSQRRGQESTRTTATRPGSTSSTTLVSWYLLQTWTSQSMCGTTRSRRLMTEIRRSKMIVSLLDGRITVMY
jgi:amidase